MQNEPDFPPAAFNHSLKLYHHHSVKERKTPRFCVFLSDLLPYYLFRYLKTHFIVPVYRICRKMTYKMPASARSCTFLTALLTFFSCDGIIRLNKDKIRKEQKVSSSKNRCSASRRTVKGRYTRFGANGFCQERGERRPSEYPTPFLSRYREVISSRPAVLIAAAGSYLQRWKRFSFPNQGGTANLSSLYGWLFFCFLTEKTNSRRTAIPRCCADIVRLRRQTGLARIPFRFGQPDRQTKNIFRRKLL